MESDINCSRARAAQAEQRVMEKDRILGAIKLMVCPTRLIGDGVGREAGSCMERTEKCSWPGENVMEDGDVLSACLMRNGLAFRLLFIVWSCWDCRHFTVHWQIDLLERCCQEKDGTVIELEKRLLDEVIDVGLRRSFADCWNQLVNGWFLVSTSHSGGHWIWDQNDDY